MSSSSKGFHRRTSTDASSVRKERRANGKRRFRFSMTGVARTTSPVARSLMTSMRLGSSGIGLLRRTVRGPAKDGFRGLQHALRQNRFDTGDRPDAEITAAAVVRIGLQGDVPFGL